MSPYLPHPSPRPINLTTSLSFHLSLLLFTRCCSLFTSLPFSLFLFLSLCAWLSASCCCLSHKHEKQTKKPQLVWNPKAHILTRVYQQFFCTHAASEATCYDKELKLCLLFAQRQTLGTCKTWRPSPKTFCLFRLIPFLLYCLWYISHAWTSHGTKLYWFEEINRGEQPNANVRSWKKWMFFLKDRKLRLSSRLTAAVSSCSSPASLGLLGLNHVSQADLYSLPAIHFQDWLHWASAIHHSIYILIGNLGRYQERWEKAEENLCSVSSSPFVCPGNQNH